MEYPKRKSNRLSEYDYSQNGAYFVTICTQDRKPILGHIVGGGTLDTPTVALTPIGEIARKYLLSGNRISGISLDKYVIMPDHIHFILLVNKTAVMGTSRAPSPTNAAVPHFVSTFKRFCHREVGAVIFQRSYYDHVIRNQQDYDEIYQYIENNPHKWVIQKRGYEPKFPQNYHIQHSQPRVAPDIQRSFSEVWSADWSGKVLHLRLQKKQ